MSAFDSQWDGRVLGERYQIEALLGRGGMSSVYRAHDPNLQRKVAVKIIHPHLTDNPQFVKRFEQEAASIAQLRHGNIVQVHDFNSDGGDYYYMVMEYIPGEPLNKKLHGLNSVGILIPLSDTVRILREVCKAVHYAHQRRMVHRDIKPANIMINLLGEPILMDFGIAKIVGSQSHTTTGAAMGTAAYMSPEQVRGEKTDYRADIYSLGITLYEMLSGATPFQGDSTFQLMLKHVNEPVPDIREFDSHVPHTIVAILERALEKDPDARYQSAAEMAHAFDAVSLQLRGSTVTNPQVGHNHGRIQSLWRQANDLFEGQEYVTAVDTLDEIKGVDPDFQPGRVRQLRQRALDRLFECATRLYRENKFRRAGETLSAYQQRAPNDPEAANLEVLIQRGEANEALLRRLTHLYDDAALLLETRRCEEALQKWATIQHLKGELVFEDRLNIAGRAREGVCASLYSQALRAVADDEPRRAALLLEQIGQVFPSYPDTQNVARSVKQLEARHRKRRYAWQVGVFFLMGLFLLSAIWFSLERIDTRLVSTPEAILGAATTSTPQETATAVLPTPTPPPTLAPLIVVPTASPSPTPTTHMTPSPTAAPTDTARHEATRPVQTKTALVIQPASLFAAPSVNATEKAIQRVGDVVHVLGRSRLSNWLYVQNDALQTGFIYGELVEWEGKLESLPIFEPEERATQTGPTTGLELDLFPLPETAACGEEGWFVTLFFEGRGGDGVYSYYWADALVASNQSRSTTVQVTSPGGALIGKGQVVSGDGQTITRELFVPPPDCFGG